MRFLFVLAMLVSVIAVSAILPQPVKANDPCHEACDQNHVMTSCNTRARTVTTRTLIVTTTAILSNTQRD